MYLEFGVRLSELIRYNNKREPDGIYIRHAKLYGIYTTYSSSH